MALTFSMMVQFFVFTGWFLLYPFMFLTSTIDSLIKKRWRTAFFLGNKFYWYFSVFYIAHSYLFHLWHQYTDYYVMQDIIFVVICIRFMLLLSAKIDTGIPLREVYEKLLISPVRAINLWSYWFWTLFGMIVDKGKQLAVKVKSRVKLPKI
jgi:hypothetical protein